MKKSSKRKEFLLAAAFLLLTALLMNLASDVFRPARVDYGSTWQAYRGEPRDSLDVLYLGSSYTYCGINPSLVYENSGLTGFVVAGSGQTLPLTYYYLKEALKTQHPKAVVLEATNFFFDTYQDYTQINVGYMPFGLNKLGAIFNASEPELRAGLLFDLSLYHDRWKELRPADIKKAIFPIRADYYKGFTAAIRVWKDPLVQPRTWDDSLTDTHTEWLTKILELCRENEIQPIVIFTPTYNRCTPEAYAAVGQIVQAAAPEAIFRNWTDCFSDFDLDPALHLYDEGHLNQEGAAIFSAKLGSFLRDEAGLVPREQSEKNATAWADAARYWNDQLTQQE